MRCQRSLSNFYGGQCCEGLTGPFSGYLREAQAHSGKMQGKIAEILELVKGAAGINFVDITGAKALPSNDGIPIDGDNWFCGISLKA